METIPEIFISYSRKDKEKVLSIVSEIEQTLGVKCWIDLEGIDSAEQFENVLVGAISQSKVVLFMMSENSMKSKFVKKEISFAHNKGIRLVPVVLDKAEWSDWFVYQFGDLNCIHYDEPDQREILLRSLGKWCEVDMEQTQLEQLERMKAQPAGKRWGKIVAISGGIAAVLLVAAIVLVALLHRQAPKTTVETPFVSQVPQAWVDTMETRMTCILAHLDTNEMDMDSLMAFHELDSLFNAKYTEVGEAVPAYNNALARLREQHFNSWVVKGDKSVDPEVALECYTIALLIKEDTIIRNKIVHN